MENQLEEKLARLDQWLDNFTSFNIEYETLLANNDKVVKECHLMYQQAPYDIPYDIPLLQNIIKDFLHGLDYLFVVLGSLKYFKAQLERAVRLRNYVASHPPAADVLVRELETMMDDFTDSCFFSTELLFRITSFWTDFRNELNTSLENGDGYQGLQRVIL